MKNRRKAMRNLMATLLFSAGVPMINAGDERAKTQQGNNNAYCQDNVISWVNWDLNQSEKDLEETVAYLNQLRRNHKVLRPSNFGNFTDAEIGSDKIRWYNRNGEIMNDDDWNNPERRTLVRYSEHVSRHTGLRTAMLLAIHGSENDQDVILPNELTGISYDLIWDSALELPPTVFTSHKPGQTVKMTGTSIMLFKVEFLTER
jgi:glycogen operon protein